MPSSITFVGKRRAYYPSGPWLDAYGKPTVSPSYEQELREARQEVDKLKKQLTHPNAEDYKIVKAEEKNGYTILKINYPDCHNYEGNKILVFKATLLDIVNQKYIDPHFIEDGKVISPIARFVPSDAGWGFALLFVNSLINK